MAVARPKRTRYENDCPRRLRLEQLESREMLAGDVFLINFQPEGAFTPNRHIEDDGSLFGLQASGFSHGWSADHTDQTFERTTNLDQRLDTLVQFESGGVWEFALPNGTYEVTASVGDPANSSTHTLNAEGASLFSGLSLAADSFQESTVTVAVSDGRLTLDATGAAPLATRLNYVYIVGVPSGPNNAPSTPIIMEPTFAGQVVNPSDVHLEAVGFSDTDGDTHANSDWQIWTDDGTGQPDELVWTTIGIDGVERVHTHLGDGITMGSNAGSPDLQFATDYLMRVRFRDSAGSVSPWASRTFSTGDASQAFPLSIEDVATSPAPTWTDGLSSDVILPGSVGTPPELRVESAAGDLLLSIAGNDGTSNIVTNPATLPDHVDTRVIISGGSTGVTLAETDLTFEDDIAQEHTIFLPALTLGASETAYLWVAADGATYFGTAGQTEPDFSNLARSSVLGFVALEPGYRVEVVAEGLQLPVNIAFVPNPGSDPDDPQFYVTELYGQVKVVLNNGTMLDYATGLLNFNPTGNFPGSGEQGVTGIVVDPANGDVIITRASDADGLPGGDHHPQVVRLHSVDEGRSSSGETVILDMVGETQGQSHQVSDVSIGPDGKLYVHNGDGFDASTALNLNSLRGKILRMNLDGSAPADNPFYNAGDGITDTDYIYAYGFRNPFGGAWRASDDTLYQVENGPGSNDRLSQGNPGVSYGWDGSAGSMTTNAIYNWSTPTAPVDMAFIQPETFGGSGFPSGNQDVAFVTESGPTWATGPQANGKKIVKFELDANGDLISGPTTFVEYVGQGKASVAGIVAGPDGLYFSDLYADLDFQNPTAAGARILRVRFDGTVAGTVDFSADNLVGETSLDVQFTDTSTVTGVSQWAWDFGDGATSTLQNPSHTYTSAGVYDVELTVITADGSKTVLKTDHVVVGYLPEDTNQDGSVDETTDKANLIAGWRSDTTNLTTQAKLFAGDSNLDGTVDLLDAYALRRAIIDSTQLSSAVVASTPETPAPETSPAETSPAETPTETTAVSEAESSADVAATESSASKVDDRPVIVASFEPVHEATSSPGSRSPEADTPMSFEALMPAAFETVNSLDQIETETKTMPSEINVRNTVLALYQRQQGSRILAMSEERLNWQHLDEKEQIRPADRSSLDAIDFRDFRSGPLDELAELGKRLNPPQEPFREGFEGSLELDAFYDSIGRER